MIKKIFSYLGPYKKHLLLCFFLVLGEVICEMVIPFLISQIVDIGIAQKNTNYILQKGLIMTALAIISIGLGIANSKFSAKVSQGLAANLRSALFNKIQTFSFTTIDKFSTASLTTRLTNDVSQIQNATLMFLRMLLRSPLMLICALIFAININFKLSIVVLIAIPILSIFIAIIIKNAEKLFVLMQKQLDNLNRILRENFIAIRVVKAFIREDYELSKFNQSNQSLKKASVKAGSLVGLIMPFMSLILNGTILVVIWIGGQMIGKGIIGTGTLISFTSYLFHILISIMFFSMIFIFTARAEASAKRIVEVLDTSVDITDSPKILKESPLIKQGKIEFKNVDFKYNQKNHSKKILSDIDLVVKPGEFTAIVGSTGSGKTTLVNLIPRLFEVTKGSVLIDDINVRDYKLNDLRQGIGMVLQQNVLFSGTIKENLLWGNETATQEEIETACKFAQAHDFIMSFPDGYNSRIDQGGVNVSGGQKQRLCIARALIKKPKILILDDSTSALDTATEAEVRKVLNTKLNDMTVLIIAQRISSVKDADKIIVLNDGKISGIGTHDSLLKTNKIYQEIYNSQQGGLVQ